MIKALVLSLKTGIGVTMKWAGFLNYTRMFKDAVFMQALKNNFIYLVITGSNHVNLSINPCIDA